MPWRTCKDCWLICRARTAGAWLNTPEWGGRTGDALPGPCLSSTARILFNAAVVALSWGEAGMDKLMPGDPSDVGRYRLLGRLGSGGMGRVYLGRSRQGRVVAVKLVHAELATDQEFRQRFRREVQAARRVVGEWTAAVVEADTEASVPWAATAYVPALSLQEAVEKYGHLPEESVWALAFGLARALEAIHGCGLVHRDLKPSNVLLTLDGPRVIDFGIARAVDGGDRLTRTGMVVGTPGFVSPEQVDGQPLTGASDVFCVGSVLTFAATGHSPFAHTGGLAAALLAVITQSPSIEGLNAPLRGLVAACLALEPAHRPAPARIAETVRAAGFGRSHPWLPPELLDCIARTAAHALEASVPTVLGEPGRQPVPERPTRPARPATLPYPGTLDEQTRQGSRGALARNSRRPPQAAERTTSRWRRFTRATRRRRRWLRAATKLVIAGILAVSVLTEMLRHNVPLPTLAAFRYTGTWQGTLESAGHGVPVVISYRDGKVGHTVATVDYPSIPCTGHWLLTAQTRLGLVVQERIDTGKKLGCKDSRNILMPFTDGTLHEFTDDFQGVLKR
jgi:eukaryotic-like serine/threonine-protein kinase